MKRIATWLALVVLAAPAAGQAIHHSIEAPPEEVRFGADVDLLGDLDGDGVLDVVVTAPDLTDIVGVKDTVSVHSTGDGAELLAVEQYALLVAGVGDVNGDGVPDFAASAGLPTQQQLILRSGADGTPLWTWNAPDDIDSLAAVGDTNLDGVPDVAVGDVASGQLGGVCCGLAAVLSGTDGGQLLDLGAPFAPAVAGNLVAAIGDVDGDGASDVAFERIIYGSAVTVHAAAGSDGHLLATYVLPASTPSVHAEAGPLGDLDGDGHGEWFVAGVSIVYGTGALIAFDGATGATLWERDGPTTFSSAGVLDADGDGARDIAFIETYDPWPDPLAVTVVSGADGGTILVAPALDKWLSGPIVGLPDVDGDGRDDLLFASTPLASSLAHPGILQVLTGAEPVILSINPPQLTYADVALSGVLEATVLGENLQFVTEVHVGEQVLSVVSFEATVLGPDKVRFEAAVPDAFGPVPVSVATPSAQSGEIDLAFVETHPPVILVPSSVFSGQSLTWTLWGEAGVTAVLLASGKPDTFVVKGWNVLRDFTPFAVTGLDALGAGSWSVPIPASASGVVLYTQMVTLQHGLLGASGVKSTIVF